MPQIRADSPHNADPVKSAQLFAPHRTKVSNSKVPECLGMDLGKIARRNPRYTKILPPAVSTCASKGTKRQKKVAQLPRVNFLCTSLYTSEQSEVNIPRIPLYLGSKLLAHLFRGIKG